MKRVARISLQCANPECGKYFAKTQARINAGRGRFCSASCRSRVVGREYGGRPPLPTGRALPPIVMACERCGQEFRTWPYRVSQGQRFCSTACKRLPPTASPPTATEIAYLAGLFDGEGCVSVQSSVRSTRQMFLVVQISNTHKEVMDWAQAKLGGPVQRIPKGHYRPIYVWKAQREQAAAFLRLVLPYLIIKRQQADVALAFQSQVALYHASCATGRPSRGLTDEEFAIREEYRLALQALKRPPFESSEAA